MDHLTDILVGQVVRSKAGRDKGRFFVVCEVLSEDMVCLVDGDIRPLERPKKKKVKHLARTKTVIPEMGDILEDPDQRYNAFIRRSLKRFQEKNQ